MIDVNPHALCLAFTRCPAGRSPLLILSVLCVLAVAMSAVGVVRRAVDVAPGVAGNLVFQTRHRRGFGLPGALAVDRRRSGRPYRPLCGPLAGFRPLSVSVWRGRAVYGHLGAFLALPSPAAEWPRSAWFAAVWRCCRQMRCAAMYLAVMQVRAGAESAGLGPLRAGCGGVKPAGQSAIGCP